MPVITDLTPDDAEQIARALSEVLGVPVMSDWVEITKDRAAGRYRITVVEEDVMAKVYPFEDSSHWADIREPMLAGYRLNGGQEFLRLDQHGQWIGQSTAGKSSIIHCAIAYATRCRNAVVWVGGGHKLYDLVAGWVEVYRNTGLPCPIDYIARGKQDTLDMMAALMSVARYRQDLPMEDRGDWPVVIFIADECAYILEDHSVSVVFDGAKVCADAMAADILRFAASGDVASHWANQHDVHACFGNKGGTLTAQFKFTGAFQINDLDALGRLMGNWKLKMPQFKGEYWLKGGDGQFPYRVKAPYIQSVDKTKPKLHDGPTVRDVAWNRRHFLTLPDGRGRTLDPGSANAAGPHYANRHRLVDDAFIAYLRNSRQAITQTALTASAIQEPPEDPELADIPECDRHLARTIAKALASGYDVPAEFMEDPELVKLVEKMQQEVATPEQDAAAMAEVSTLAGRQSLREHIWQIVAASSEPMTRAEIVAELVEQGRRVSDPQMVTNDCGKLVKATPPRLERLADGRYVTVSGQTHKQTHTPTAGG